MKERAAGAGAPHPGLCAGCRNRRWTSNRRGSSFLLCALAKADPRFPKYPPLPVRSCAGFAPGEPPTEERGAAASRGADDPEER